MRFIPLKFFNFCAACVAFLSGVESGRILCFFSVPSISHQLVFQPIWKSLALRGHELIVVTPDPLNDPTLTNLREINVNDSYEIFNRMNLHEAMSADKTMAQQLYHGMSAVLAITEHQLNNPQFKKILDDPGEKFDLIMYESLSPVLIGLSYRFAAPIIGVSSLAPPVNVHEMVGNPSHPLLHFGLGVLQTFQPETGFSERLFRTWCSLYYRLFTHFYTLPESDAIARRHFGEGMPHLGELQRRVDMVFAGSNPFVDGFRPTVPAYVDLRFVHLRQKQPLNKDLQMILDEAKEGVIYFSLGSNVKSVNLDEELKKTIKEALAELPYKIIFKWESDHMPGKPDNVITRKWLPQQDLLGHPNVKAFVTQGGLQSLEEAIVNAVPIVGVPFFADQPMNVGQAVKHGFGIHLDPKTVTKNELKEAITQVAENKKYREKIKELRDVLLDQPMTGVEKAVWWTEYVIRHKGAKHLRSATLDIPWYQYFLLDVFAAILAAILVAVYVIFKIAKLLVGFSLRQKVKVKSA